MTNNGITPKEKTKPSKAFSALSATEKWALLEVLLRDLGYID
jgi:hypothetical protein